MYPFARHPHRNPNPKSTEIRPAFDVLDADRDGRISGDDLRVFFSRVAAASDNVIAAMISAADADCSGFVEFDEFEQILAVAVADDGDGEIMEEAFGLMDRDGDGKVGFDDLKAYLKWAGMAASDEDVREMMRSGGCDESAGVGLDDLLRILAVDSEKRI